MDIAESAARLLLEYGILGLGWVAFAVLLRWVLTTWSKDRQATTAAMTQMAASFDSLEKWVRERER